MQKVVTMGWDMQPTILNEDGTIFFRGAELFFNKDHYPNWPEEKWPVNPETGLPLQIAEDPKSGLFEF